MTKNACWFFLSIFLCLTSFGQASPDAALPFFPLLPEPEPDRRGVFRADLSGTSPVFSGVFSAEPGPLHGVTAHAFFRLRGDALEFVVRTRASEEAFRGIFYTPSGSIDIELGEPEFITVSHNVDLALNPFIPRLPPQLVSPAITAYTHYHGSVEVSPDIRRAVRFGRAGLIMLGDRGGLLSAPVRREGRFLLVRMSETDPGAVEVDYAGTLETSPDLKTWKTVEQGTCTAEEQAFAQRVRFFRLAE